MNLDSTLISLKGRGMNPFRSRSTVICISCLVTLIIVDSLALRAGFFTTEFAGLSIFVLRDIIDKVFNHQKQIESVEAKKTISD